MSKKRFTDGLDSIFLPDPKDDGGGRGTAFLRNPFEPEPRELGADGGQPGGRKASSRKTFTTDLDSLLEEALQESFAEQMQPAASDSKAQVFHQQAHRKKPFGGLDLLIRRTVETADLEFHQTERGTRRLTVAFDTTKLEKLKQIARLEKSYLKDILSDLVAEYIRRYEKQKGHLE